MALTGLVVSETDGVTVATLSAGAILEAPVVDELAKALYALVDEQARRKVVVDFRAVGFLASQMIGVLVALDSKARAIDGQVVLCGLRPKLMEVFKIMGLHKRLAFAPDESAAMGLF